MGSIKSLKKLTKSIVNSSDDDQLYYQLEYLNSVEGKHELNIRLDAEAHIFQTLSSHFYHINIDYNKSKVVNGHEQFTIHAEQNALCDAADRGVSVSDGTAYITHFPCLNCFKLLIASGISKIKYFNDYKNSELVNAMAIENNIRLIKL